MYIEYLSLYSRIAEFIFCLKIYASNATFGGHFYTALLKKMRYIWIALLICSFVCWFVGSAPFCYLCFICTEKRSVQLITNLVKLISLIELKWEH